MRLRLVALLLVSLLIAACDRQAQYEQQIYVFGTLVDITVFGTDPQRARAVVDEIAAEFQQMHREWHAWEPGPLVELNDAIARGEPAEVLPSLVPIIEQSRELYEKSDGLFNPAIGALLNLWGFQSSEPPSGPPPAREAVAALVAADPGMDDVALENGTLRSSNPVVRLDFGGFAKGYAVDRAIERLRAAGFEDAIVNAGGDLRAIGSHGDRPWRVGVRHPQGQGILAAIEVSGDESIFTSGNYVRFREHEGVHYQHILDPRTGWPVQGVTSVTVIHDNGAEADAAATALVVAGPKEWERIARRMEIRHVMLVDDAGTVYMTPSMVERVQFQSEPARIVVGEGVRSTILAPAPVQGHL